jgi:hypothetical protein
MEFLENVLDLQMDDGWVITVNAFSCFPIFANTIVFNATNLNTGKELTIEFENEEKGYVLSESLIRRKQGDFSFGNDDNIYREVNDQTESNLLPKLRFLLNPKNKSLCRLKIYGGWLICRNNLLLYAEDYEEIDFVFFATKNKYFIDVSYIKNDINPFKICIGMDKHNFQGVRLQVNNLELSKELELESIAKVISFIEEYIKNPEKLLSSATKL